MKLHLTHIFYLLSILGLLTNSVGHASTTQMPQESCCASSSSQPKMAEEDCCDRVQNAADHEETDHPCNNQDCGSSCCFTCTTIALNNDVTVLLYDSKTHSDVHVKYVFSCDSEINNPVWNPPQES